MPGGVDFDGGVVRKIVGELLGGGESGGVEVAVAPVGIDVAGCADEDWHGAEIGR